MALVGALDKFALLGEIYLQLLCEIAFEDAVKKKGIFLADVRYICFEIARTNKTVRYICIAM